VLQHKTDTSSKLDFRHFFANWNNALNSTGFFIKRINVIGTSGSDKTTFSRQLNYPYIQMGA